MENKLANDIYDGLIQTCGAPVDGRDSFVEYLSTNEPHKEWRFQGKLGFGGKFHETPTKMYVSCYPEDMNPDRMSRITRTNRRIQQLVEESNASASKASTQPSPLLE